MFVLAYGGQQLFQHNLHNNSILLIQGNSHTHEYIATQHPLEDTISDFWRMVYQEGVRIILMLNQMKEDNMVIICLVLYIASKPKRVAFKKTVEDFRSFCLAFVHNFVSEP